LFAIPIRTFLLFKSWDEISFKEGRVVTPLVSL
jgi:hypothetical protein